MSILDIRSNVLRRCGLIFSTAAIAFSVQPSFADTVNGTGKATITKDAETVRNAALAEARRDIIRAMLSRTIGDGRISEVPIDTIQRMANQIRPDMITAQNFARGEGSQFVATITADIDRAWFTGLLSDANIDTSAMRAGGDQQLISVYLDQVEGTGSDISKPAEVDIAYDRRTGSSFSDHSSVKSSSRAASASSSRSASATSQSAAGASRSSLSGAYSSKAAAAYGASDGVSAVGASGRRSESGGFSGKSATAFAAKKDTVSVRKSSSASASSSSFSDKTSVDAENHDDVSYRAHVVYQQPPKSADAKGIMSALSGKLLDYDVAVAEAWQPLAEYFHGHVPRYEVLKGDPSSGGFFADLAEKRNTPFFLGGTFSVTYEGTDTASGRTKCSGQISASVIVTSNSRIIASGSPKAEALGSSVEDCRGELTNKLATAAASEWGPEVQKYWRSKARSSVGQDSQQQANYTIVLRAPKLEMGLQQDLFDAIQSTQGAKFNTLVSQTNNELRITVSYAGSMPLQFAIFQQLRGKPGFSSLIPSSEGRNILLCLVSCEVGK